MTEVEAPRNLDFILKFVSHEKGMPYKVYSLRWVPNPVWHKMGDDLWQVNPLRSEIHNGPEYCLGYLSPLIGSEALDPDTYSTVYVFVLKYDSETPLERGSEEDLKKMIQDLQDYSFQPKIIRPDSWKQGPKNMMTTLEGHNGKI